jgi:nitrate reductase delta subunit
MDDYENAIFGWGVAGKAGAKLAEANEQAKAAGADDSDEGDDFAFGTTQNVVSNPAHFEAIERIREWTRERFKLPEDAGILVTEVECKLPGCPPVETVVAFWENPERRYHFKMFKNATEVTTDDIPFAWLKESLYTPDGFGCECC